MPVLTFDVQTEVDGEFEVYCAKCGTGLCNNCTEGTTRSRGMPYISVEPCEKCLSEAEGQGYDEGHDDGYEEGRKE